MREDWEKVKKYYEAWWNCEALDKVPLWMTVPRQGYQTGEIPTGNAEDRLFDKEKVIQRVERNFQATFYGGLAFPCYWPNFGPDVFSAYLGATLKFPTIFSLSSPVSWADWTKPVLKDYSDLSSLSIREDNFYWRKTKELISYALERFQGNYLVGLTDIHAGIDALAVLRGGPEQLCMDLIENSEGVKKAINLLREAWHEVYEEQYRIIKEHQKGTSAWIGLWSPGKMYPVQNDLSCLISPAMYKEFFLEELISEIDYLDHSIYHLDGPDSLKHLDLLLDIPRLNAIQWVSGTYEKKESIAKWIPLYRKIQAGRKAIIVYCRADEVEFVLENLHPEGLLIAPACSSEEEARDLLAEKGWL